METQQAVGADAQVDQVAARMSSIVPVENAGVAKWQSFEWTPERIDLARQIFAPKATPQDFEFFLEWCRQTGLNPFIKQAFFVERWDSESNTKRFEPMAAEAGFAARLDAMPDYRGMKAACVFAGDRFFIDEVEQKITHEWSLEARQKAGMKLLGAWAHGKREGRTQNITYLSLESRIQKRRDGAPTKFWANDGAGQLLKCARADQARRMYPNALAGWYDAAEFATGDEVREIELNSAPVPVPGNANSKSEAMAARLGVKPLTVEPARGDRPPAPTPTPSAGKKAEPAADPGVPCMEFGPLKGVPLAEIGLKDLSDHLVLGNQNLEQATKDKQPWAAKLALAVEQVRKELNSRLPQAAEREEGAAPAPAEPGSEG